MRENNQNGRPTLMLTTPGITSKRFCRNPLGTEGEMSPGDDRANPYRSVEEREYVEEVERKEKERQDSELFKTGNPVGGESDPFTFDDLGSSTFDLPEFGQPQDVDLLGIEAFDPMNDKGPMW
jgi:hypothetical protein